MSEIEMGTVYDLNKQLVETQEKEICPYKLNGEKKKLIKDFLREQKEYFYFMLLCKEKSDYTVFNFNKIKNENKIEEATNILVDECLKNRGQIKGVDLTEDKNAIEIWLSIDGESYCYYFFSYDNGIIEI